MVWPRKEVRRRIHRKKDSGDGTIAHGRRKRGSPKQRWLDGVNRDMSAIGTTKNEVRDRTSWMRIVSAAATPQLSGSIEEEGESRRRLVKLVTY